MLARYKILLLTDFSYQAKGRDYFQEDIELSIFLRSFFEVYICHIKDANSILDHFDAIVLRNTGPQISHQSELLKLKNRSDLILFNDLKGKGDIEGKQHLLELFKLGFPVIPTFSSLDEVLEFETFKDYLLKPLNGADSFGVKILSHQELLSESLNDILVQPVINFKHEISFYFINEEFHYALYAPNPLKRWEMKFYPASPEDIEFAFRFIQWNSCKFGIQRVDGCRTKDGKLLLMELEDYNPFLSLNLLEKHVKERFLKTLCLSLNEMIEQQK